jgi:hypothetical protein
MTQLPLDWNPPPMMTAIPDRRLPPEARARFSRLALLILGRLQKGPADNRELVRLTSHRFGARVQELRDAGHTIDAVSVGGGRWVYTLRR